MARHEEDRGRRDEAGVGPYLRGDVQLVPLKELGDWDVAAGEPDIRGWEVRTLGGRVIGKVEDLLIDTAQGEVVMVDVDIEGSDRHTIAPLRAAQIDREERIIRIDSADLQDEGLPSIARREVSDAEAKQFDERYRRSYGNLGFADDRNYVVRGGDHDIHFTRRAEREQTGAREAVRRDWEEGQREARQRQEQEGERRAAKYPAPGEERVVERRPVVVEEVVVRRRVVDERQAGAASERAENEKEIEAQRREEREEPPGDR
jgi:sporulation protein YlmC with PRC-barrel domain